MIKAYTSLLVFSTVFVAGAATGLSGRAFAAAGQQTPISAGVNISTLGLGVQASGLIDSNLAIRAGYNKYDYSHNWKSGSLDYDGKLKLGDTTIVADLYPNKVGTFHYSAGFMIDNNKIDATGKGSGSYTLNGTSYPVADVGSLVAHVNYNNFAPYLGIGWGKPMSKGKLQVTFDLGAMFQGSSSASLNGSNPSVLTLLPPALAATYEADRQAQEKRLKDDADKFSIYPVVTLGVVINLD